MRRRVRPLFGSLLLGAMLCSSADAQAQPSSRVLLGFAPGVGYFLYSQQVDGGYAINGRPYDLTWSGVQLQFSGDVHQPFTRHPTYGLGMAASFMLAPNPTGAAWGHGASVDPDRPAVGGYLAFSGYFRPEPAWRVTVHTGVANNGASGGLGFGGWGLAVGAAVHHMLGPGGAATGFGLRLNCMALSSSRERNVRGESGLYVSLMAEALFEVGLHWTPSTRHAQPRVSDEPPRSVFGATGP